MASLPRPRVLPHPALTEKVHDPWGPLGSTLAIAAGLAHHSRMSRLLNGRPIPDTHGNREALARIAAVVGYTGPLFEDAQP